MRTIELEIDKIKCIVTNARSYRKKAEKSTSNGNMERYTASANNHVEKYKDWIVNSNKEDLLVYSKMRGVTFVIADLIFKLKNNPDSANEDWHYMFNLILKADAEYEIENSESVNSEQYIKLIKKYYESDMAEEENKKTIQSKQEAKKVAKQLAKFKYSIGDKYAIRKKTVSGDEMGAEIYEVKKFIYSIGCNIVNSVVMKQIAGNPCKRKTLSIFDCQTFHIKYEPGLYIFSMNTSFFKLPKDYIVKEVETGKLTDGFDSIINECDNEEESSKIEEATERTYPSEAFMAQDFLRYCPYSENLKNFNSSAITCPYSTYCDGDLSKCEIATNYSNHRINFRLSEETKKMLNYDVNSPLPLLMY